LTQARLTETTFLSLEAELFSFAYSTRASTVRDTRTYPVLATRHNFVSLQSHLYLLSNLARTPFAPPTRIPAGALEHIKALAV
jgi:hypothetical protein